MEQICWHKYIVLATLVELFDSISEFSIVCGVLNSSKQTVQHWELLCMEQICWPKYIVLATLVELFDSILEFIVV